MAISLFGEVHNPPGDNDNAPSGPTVSFTPPGSMVTGDFVLVSLVYRGAVTWTNSTSGGQTWSSSANTQSGTTNTARLFWCVYNGTWAADPVFTVTTGTAGCSGWMAVFRGVDPSSPWDVTPVIAAQATSLTYVIATYDTATNNAWAIVGASSADNNTWTVDNTFVAPSGSGNVYWRSAAGTDNSLVMCRKLIATAGAVGATTMTQATLGDDLGTKWYGALKSGLSTTLTETATLTDPTVTTKQTPYKQLCTETAALSHNVLNLAGIILLEALTLSDAAPTRAPTKNPVETIVLADATVETTKVGEKATYPTETLVLADTLSKAVTYARTLTETSTLTGSVQNATGRAVADTLLLTDAVLKQQGRTFSSVLTLTESATKGPGRTLVSAITLTEGVTKGTARILVSAVTLTDGLQKGRAPVYSSVITLSDFVIRGPTRVLVSTVTLADSIERGATRVLTESASLADTFSSGKSIVLTETISLSGSFRLGTVIARETLKVGDSSWLTTPLISYYAFDGNVTTSPDPDYYGNDSHVGLRHLTKVGSPSGTASGKNSRGIQLNGSANYFSHTSTDFRPSSNGVTVSVWVYFAGTAGLALIVDEGDGAYTDFTLELTAANVRATATSGLTPSTVRTASIARGAAGVWNHWVLRYNPVTRVVSLTKNATTTDNALAFEAGDYIRAQGNRILLGSAADAGETSVYDEAAIFGYCLSDDEVAELYAATVGKFYPFSTLKKDTSRTLVESTVLTDTFSSGAKATNPVETLTLSDSLVLGLTAARTLTEAVTLTDATVGTTLNGGAYSKELTETLILSHEVLNLAGIVLRESATLTATVTTPGQVSLVETLTLADPVLTWPNRPTLTETVTLTDPQLIRGRIYSETVTLADTFSTSESVGLVETAVLTDSLILARAAERTFTESVSLADSTTNGAGKTLAEALTLADTVTPETAAERILLETIVLNAVRQFSTARVLADAVVLIDSLVRGRAAARTLVETLVLGDSLSTQASNAVSVPETVTLGDSLSIGVTAERELTEGVSLGDDLWFGTGRAVTETLGLAGVLTNQTQIVRTLVETLSLSDPTVVADLTHQGSFSKTPTETVLLADSLVLARAAARTLSETVVLTDQATKSVTRVLPIQTVALADSLTLVKALGRSFTETVTLTGSLASQSGNQANLPETLALSDTLTLGRTAARTLLETATLAHTISAAKGGGADLPDPIVLGDTLRKDISRTLTESATLDADVRFETARTLTEGLTLSGLYNASKTGEANSIDVLHLEDACQKDTSRTLTETVALSDSRGRDISREIQESAVLSDLLAQLAGGDRVELAETIVLTDSLIQPGIYIEPVAHFGDQYHTSLTGSQYHTSLTGSQYHTLLSEVWS